MNKVNQSLDSIVSAFQGSLSRDMPQSTYQQFHLWALSPANSHYQTWWQIIGLPQFAMLTTTLLDKLVNADQWPQLLEYAAPMNNYLIYETISDNLAMGIQSLSAEPQSRTWQTEVLYQFNEAMIRRLMGEPRPTTEALADIKATTQCLSYFDYSLTHDELETFAQSFIQQHAGMWQEEIEFGVWNALVANIESCFHVSEVLRNSPLDEVIRLGFVERYQAVNTLLVEKRLSLQQLMEAGSRAILVMPVLAYYIGALAEVKGTAARLPRLQDDDLLCNTLYDAAMLVRLTNDLGTELVMHRRFHSLLLNELAALSEPSMMENIPLGDLLLGLAADMPFLTRINKDLLHGEFNLFLNDLTHLPCTPQVIRQIEFKLCYFQRQYSEGRTRLLRSLRTISKIMGDDTISTLILRFVEFHEQLYNHPFDAQVGDYATKPIRSILPAEN